MKNQFFINYFNWLNITLLLFFLMVLSNPIHAEMGGPADITENSTLKDLLIFSQVENPDLQASYDLWQADRQRTIQNLAIPNPQITYSRFVEEVETRVGPMKDQFSISQTIPWPLHWYFNWNASRKNALASEQRYVAKRLTVLEGVKNTFYEYYYLNKAIQITRENLDLIQYLEKVAGARYRTARGSHANLIKAQVELGKLEDQLKTLKDFETTIKAELNALLNRPSQAPLPKPTELTWEKVPLSRNFLLAKLEQKNPELNALHFEMLKAREEKKRALQAYFPNLKFFSSYTFVDPAMPNAMTGMIPADSGKDAFTLGGGLEVPIWFFKNYAEHKEASLRQNAVMNRKVGLRNTLEKNVEKIFFKVRDAERKIDLYKTILIPKAEEALKSAITAFSSGNIDFVNLIDTERTALEFSLVYERSLTNYLQGLAQLEVLMGSEFSQLDMGSKETGDKP